MRFKKTVRRNKFFKLVNRKRYKFIKAPRKREYFVKGKRRKKKRIPKFKRLRFDYFSTLKRLQINRVRVTRLALLVLKKNIVRLLKTHVSFRRKVLMHKVFFNLNTEKKESIVERYRKFIARKRHKVNLKFLRSHRFLVYLKRRKKRKRLKVNTAVKVQAIRLMMLTLGTRYTGFVFKFRNVLSMNSFISETSAILKKIY